MGSAAAPANQAIFSHLLSDTACFDSGIYIQPPLTLRSRRADFLSSPRLDFVARTRECGPEVTVLQPIFTLPFSYRLSAITQMSTVILERALQKHYLRGRPYVLWMNSVSLLYSYLGERLGKRAEHRIFDSSDDFTMYDSALLPQVLQQQQRVLKTADRVLCVNEHVAKKISHPNKRVFLNCTEFETLQKPARQPSLQPLFPKPAGAVYIGFIGMIAGDRFDMDLLNTLFQQYPQYRFVFVGSTNKPSLLAALTRFPNVVFVPEVPHTDLPAIIRSFDVALVPHLNNEYTRGNDLLKVLDYMACGVPVVSTISSNVQNYGDALYLANSKSEFVSLVGRLATNSSGHNPAPGLAIARERSWNNRVSSLLPWIFDADKSRASRPERLTGSLAAFSA